MVRALGSVAVAALLGGASGVRPASVQTSDPPSEASEVGSLGLKAGDGIEKYHLARDGAKACDFGTTITETNCEEVGHALLLDMHISPGRDYLVAGGLKTAPPGCSLQTQVDFAVVYNTDAEGDNDGSFAPICEGKIKEVHSVKVGENECDYGRAVAVDKCLAAANKELQRHHGDTETQQVLLNVGQWSTRPPGCSMHIAGGASLDGHLQDQGDSGLVWFNTQQDGAKNDGTSVLLCTGTPV